MLTFHPLGLGDKAQIDRFVRKENSRSADFNFGTQFLWSGLYGRFVADRPYYLQMLRPEPEAEDRDPLFLWPIGSDDPAPVLREMEEYARAEGISLQFFGLEERHVQTLEALFPGKFAVAENRDYEDYIYEAEKLVSLSGKHLHGKRNHINRFIQEHDWRFEPLKPELFPECTALLDGWAEHTDTAAGMVGDERNAILAAFQYYDTLELMGGALFAEEQLVAFTIGQRISSDTFQVRFEKARGDINGAYPMINREFVKLVLERAPEIRYINREDDMGLENLRKSKESYYPAFLLRKFTARQADAL